MDRFSAAVALRERRLQLIISVVTLLAFIIQDACSMTHCMLVRLQHGLNMIYFIYLQRLSQTNMPLWVIKELTHFLAPIFSSVNSLNYFHLLPKPFLNFIRPAFRRNSDGLCITSSSMWEIVGNPCQLGVMLEQPWLACLWEWAIHGRCPGHHATGLLLETWTLGNAGMNSRSLCDCSTCSLFSVTQQRQNEDETVKPNLVCLVS